MAIEDAVVLAEVLGSGEAGFGAALEAFMARRYPRAEAGRGRVDPDRALGNGGVGRTARSLPQNPGELLFSASRSLLTDI